MNSGWVQPCGCQQDMTDGLLTSYKRCDEHYQPEDDEKILLAAKNARDLRRLWEQSDH